MKPAVVIPTYWSESDRLGEPGQPYCYDHATPLSAPTPELVACLASLCQVRGLDTVILLVVAPPSVEEEAVHRVHQIAQESGLPNVVIVDSFKAYNIVDMFQPLIAEDMGEPVGLRGYGAIRNMGFIACAALGCDVTVFLDDDEVVLDPDFLVNAVYGMGVQTRSGAPVVVKTGYFLDRHNSALADRRNPKRYDRFWSKRSEFNAWMTQAIAGPRIARSNVLCGGCSAIHAEAYTRVPFDPWITRGEDLDYLVNLKLYGLEVWFDTNWRVRHTPPRIADTAFRFEQDVYRWTYERRKIEVCNGNIDFHKVLAEQLMPYPGPWIGPELPKRILKTSLLRALQTKEHAAYFKIFAKGRKEAVAYAEENCTRYLQFLAYWNGMATFAWQNEAMEHILLGEGMLNAAIAMRMAERNGGRPFDVPASDSDIIDPDDSPMNPDAGFSVAGANDNAYA